jgi:hypothetical protein
MMHLRHLPLCVCALLAASSCKLSAGTGTQDDDSTTSETTSGTSDVTSTTSTQSTGSTGLATMGGTGDSTGGTDETGSTGGTGWPDDTEVWELRVEGFQPPMEETWYSCFSFQMDLEQLQHIVGFEAVVTEPTVHHSILSLHEGALETDPNEPCYDWPARMIWGWAPGIEPLMLPEDAGILVGDGAGGVITLVLQVHYNNPLLTPVTDEGGIDVIVTSNLREHDAFVFAQGDISTIAIPPGEAAYTHVARCEGDVTQALIDEPIHAFSSFLHAHEIGSAITSELWRNGELHTEIASQVPYDFNQQQFQPIDLDILPGDMLETRCTYDSTGRTQVTNGGVGSTDEMCINFMMYYPRIAAEQCGAI